MDKLKEKLSRLMYGRYGIDQLGNFLVYFGSRKSEAKRS